MSRILIWRQVIPGSDIDIWAKTDYSKVSAFVNQKYGGNCPNWGNKLWFQGLYSEIDTPDNCISVRKEETVEEINEKYDMIIYPMANYFSVEYCSDTTSIIEALSGIRICRAWHQNERAFLF